MKNNEPEEVKDGSITVRIYHIKARARPHRYESWKVRYYLLDEQINRKFSSLEKARDHAAEAIGRIKLGHIKLAMLNEEDTYALARAQEFLIETGVSIDVAAKEFAEAWKVLKGVPVIEAARYYKRQHPDGFSQKPISQIVEELLTHKIQDGLSSEWIRELRTRLNRFVAKFGDRDLGGLTSSEIDDWLRSLSVGPKTRNNFRGCLSTLFTFARSRRHLPRDFNELDFVPTAKSRIGEIHILTPNELKEWLSHCTDQMKLFLLLGAFAGLRHFEIKRLHWNDVKWKSNVIEVNAKHSKVSERRLAPLLPVLRKWIEPMKGNGKIIHIADTNDLIARLAVKAEKEWKQNSPRHSFISYRVAQTRDIAMVADEAGTSVQKIKTNYLKRVLPEEAEIWFNLKPSSVQSVPK